ncbi:MAG: hypothetical protein GY870_02210 [archaeon]|nr:hypothetical protein [archaeon]
MVNLLIATILGLTSSIFLSISKGLQKFGIEGISLKILKEGRKKPELRRKFWIWMIGTIGCNIAAIIFVIAQPFAPNASYVSAFSGIGLSSLIIFSYYVLKEKIKKPEIIGLIIIVIATFIFGTTTSEESAGEPNYGILIILAIVPTIIIILLGFWSKNHNHKAHAVIWGSFAGLCAGISTALFHTSAVSADRGLLAMLITIDFWIATSVDSGSFIFTQWGFKYGQASIVVTMYNTMSIVFPIIVDIFVFQAHLNPITLAMFGCIIVGVVLLTAFREESSFSPESTEIQNNS